MRWKLFTLAAAVSAVLCLAGAALCVRGFVVGDEIALRRIEDDPASQDGRWVL